MIQILNRLTGEGWCGEMLAALGGIVSWASGGKTEQKRSSADVGVDGMNNVTSCCFLLSHHDKASDITAALRC